MTSCKVGTSVILLLLQHYIQSVEENQDGILMARKNHKNYPAQETKNEIRQWLQQEQLTRVDKT